MRRMRYQWLVLVAALPTAAFVFVPQRAPHAKVTLAGTTARSVVKADSTGLLYVANPTDLRGAGRDGADTWSVAGQFEPVLEPTNHGVLTIGVEGGGRKLLAYSPRGAVLWSRALGSELLYMPHPPAKVEATDYGVVDLLDHATGTLTVVDLATGATKGQRVLGEVIGEPVCVEDTMFAATKAAGGGEQVAVVDMVHSGATGDRGCEQTWAVPAGEHVRRLTWSAEASLLLVSGQKSTYALD
ncbi:MAG: hypothetical protein HZB16_24780 [Armatimonadetes bacterium]|nr:hypothetical protein [Armatimonadota bacterium]